MTPEGRKAEVERLWEWCENLREELEELESQISALMEFEKVI